MRFPDTYCSTTVTVRSNKKYKYNCSCPQNTSDSSLTITTVCHDFHWTLGLSLIIYTRHNKYDELTTRSPRSRSCCTTVMVTKHCVYVCIKEGLKASRRTGGVALHEGMYGRTDSCFPPSLSRGYRKLHNPTTNL